MAAAVLVLDVGKTNAKLTLASLGGGEAVTRTRANAAATGDGEPVLDAAGIEAWMAATMAELADLAEIAAIVPVAHAAAAALVSGDRLAAPVLDYEAEPPAPVAAAYDARRDPFERTLSPRLPGGLNLGVQLLWREDLLRGDVALLPWAQYWAWRLCGERASEATSLGSHTDLWFPREETYSDLAWRQGWARRFAPLRKAGEVLGDLRADLAARTGVSRSCQVLCGLHDSNASLCAARALPEVAGGPFSLVSTGTWFVVMQSGASGESAMDERKAMLGNVDVEGRVVPTAGFMGGREFAAAAGPLARGSTADAEQLIGGAEAPRNAGERAALASLRLAIKTDAHLDLVRDEGQAERPVVVEGRFAADPIYARALASLRPMTPVLCARDADGVALGAARLFAPHLAPAPARRAEPLGLDLRRWANRFRADRPGASPTPVREASA